MAQLSNPNADAALRKHLIALRTELRMLFTDTLLGESPEWGEYAYRECSKGVDPLVAGEAVLVRRYELPVGHALAAPAAGHPTDWLELGADDALRPTSQRKDTVIADVDRVFDPHAPATQNRSSTYFPRRLCSKPNYTL